MRINSSATDVNDEPTSSQDKVPDNVVNEKPVPIEENPFYHKYSEKIKNAKLKTKSSRPSTKVNSETPGISKSISVMEESLSHGRDSSMRFSKKKTEGVSRRKELKDIVHMEKLLELDSEGITQVWQKHHETKKDVVYAVIPKKEYQKFKEMVTNYPLFLLPLPKNHASSSGYELYLSKFSSDTFFLTQMAVFKSQGELSVPSIVMTYFPELMNEKGLVLMTGDFDPSVVSLLEVQCLANQLKMFYSDKDVTKTLLLHKFNKEPDTFDYKQVISELENKLPV